MIYKNIDNFEYKMLLESQIKEQISYVLSKNQEFSIVINTKKIDFNPKLPKKIMDNIDNFALFTLANYTYSTINLYSDFMTFETGFGEENIGSTLTVPYDSILQIIIEDKIVFLSYIATIDTFKIETHKRSSMDMFKSNPNNKKFNK